ncbi:Gfo/Idh/MocA family protein [Marinoscillum sp. MHG1-6]|uniref:Gfo/Idh/MocA family protein n=1 Tax=Marinoscillum sp. MHG1-6 TaxID=2959627 RepID=UPI00215710ED|nr:Gfo/Idh/MocA family oxidoreductase [Marinoscillum sp. MHG1-6]
MDRRSFLIKSGLASGGLALGSTFLSANSISKRKLCVGVIGTGDRGQGLLGLISQIDQMEAIGCCDVIPFRLEKGLSLASPKAKGYKDYRKLLEDKSIDCVIICTPFSLHGQMAIDALNAGKHVYCEKTMAMGIDSIQKTIAVAQENPGLIFQTGHQYHTSELYRKVREIIQSGYIGDVTAYHCQWNRNGNWRREVPDPKWERIINWRMYKEYSGGLIAELMSHQIDFINWTSESTPAKFAGFGGVDHWKDGRETFDNVHLQIAYENGLDATFSCTTTNGFEDYQIKVLGSQATIVIDYNDAMIYPERTSPSELGMVDGVSGATLQSWQKGQGVPIPAKGMDPTKQSLIEFRNCVFEGRQPESGVETGGMVAKCVHIALDAVRNSQVKLWSDYPKLTC